MRVFLCSDTYLLRSCDHHAVCINVERSEAAHSSFLSTGVQHRYCHCGALWPWVGNRAIKSDRCRTYLKPKLTIGMLLVRLKVGNGVSEFRHFYGRSLGHGDPWHQGYKIWLVVWNMFLFFHIFWMSSAQLINTFQRGRSDFVQNTSKSQLYHRFWHSNFISCETVAILWAASALPGALREK